MGDNANVEHVSRHIHSFSLGCRRRGKRFCSDVIVKTMQCGVPAKTFIFIMHHGAWKALYHRMANKLEDSR